MAIDALVKRFFPAVVMLLIALAAYFQARGLVQLATTAIVANDEPSANQWRDFMPASGANTEAAPRTAEPILSRNPFDSVTGPLNAHPTDATSATPAVDLSNPLLVPDCAGVSVRIVTESPDPTWSIAVVVAPGDPLGKLRRVGDDVGDKQVAYIGFNPEKNSPAVWLSNASALCQVLLFAPPAAAQPPPAAAAPTPPEEASAAPRPRGGGTPVPKDIADRIHQVSDTQFNVDKGVVDNILENQAQLMSSARIVPEQRDGKVVGIRLFGVRPDTLLGKLGLQNGDRLDSINGFEMASPEKALEAYARLRTADKLTVQVTRRGKPMTLDFNIQ